MQKTVKVQGISSQDWELTYNIVKENSNYKFLYGKMDTYVKKFNDFLNHHQQPDHIFYLQELQNCFLRIIDDINMVNLSQLASCVQNIFDKFIVCQKMVIKEIESLQTNVKRVQQDLTSRSFNNHRCIDCKKFIYQSKIEDMMRKMTITKQSPHVAEEIKKINMQLQEISMGMDHIQLRLMIDQVLRNKEVLLNQKNQNGAIYDEITSYLSQISQSTINMSRQDIKNIQIQSTTSSFSENLEGNLNKIIEKPMRKIVQRILEFAKRYYEKNVKLKSVAIQTKLTSNDDQINKLQRDNESLQRQLYNLRKSKRQVETDIIKQIENQQKQEIKLLDLSSKNIVLDKKYNELYDDYKEIKRKHEELQKKKNKQSEVQTFIQEKNIMLKTIRQLQLKVSDNEKQIKILKRQGDDYMVSRQTSMAYSRFHQDAETQTQNRMFQQQSRLSLMRHRYKKSGNITRVGSLSPFDSQHGSDKILEKEENNDNFNKISGNKLLPKKVQKQNIIPKQINQSKRENNRVSISKNIKQKSHKQSDNSNFISRKNTIMDMLSDEEEKVGISNFQQDVKDVKGFKIQTLRQLNQQNQKISLNDSKNSKKLMSSRMFFPNSHSPYTAPQKGSNFVENFDYKDFLQINAVKRQSSNEEEDETKVKEKIKFLKRISEVYSQLKSSGCIDRIQQLVIEQLRKSSQESETKMHIMVTKYERRADKQQKQFKKYDKKKLYEKQKSKIKVSKSKKQLLKNASTSNMKVRVKNNSQVISSKIFIKNSCRIFSFNDALLLFDSIENMKSFEDRTDIWAALQSSLAINYNFMSFCDKIHSFFEKIKKRDQEQFEECLQFLTTPIKYFEKMREEEQAFMNTDGFKSMNKFLNKEKKHRRNMSCLPEPINIMGTLTEHKTYQIRSIFHLIIRFHKVQHRKCRHVQDFLQKLGYGQKL